MTWTTDTLAVRVWHGECLDALRAMPDSSVDSIITDPPYGLSDFPAPKVIDAITKWATDDRGFIPEGAGFMGRCFHPDTDVLTTQGWKRVQDVAVGDTTYSLSPSGSTEITEVVATHSYDFAGDLLRAGGRSALQVVTPNHNVLHGERGKWKLTRADSLPSQFMLQNQGAPYEDQRSLGVTEFAGRKWDDDALGRFIGMWLGDGYLCARVNQPWKQDFLGIAVKKPRKLLTVRDTLISAGVKFTETPGRNGDTTNFYVYDADVREALRPFAGAHNKAIPPTLFGMSQKGLESLYRGLIETDGCTQGVKGQEVFCTVSTALSDDFQRLCLLTGRSATRALRHTPRTTINGAHVAASTSWVLSVLPRGKRGVWVERDGRSGTRYVPPAVTKVPYEGKVHCVTVSAHSNVMTRFEGKMVWSGNSWDSFVPPPLVWDECLRVLKPGGHMAVFAGARTVDLMGLSIRMSGFELRDTLAWIRGDGMPKGQEVSRAMVRKGADPSDAAVWEDWHSALKPSVEPIVLARKPLAGTLINNVAEHGTGAMNMGACRIAASGRPLREVRINANQDTGVFNNGKGSIAVGSTDLGRFPANVVLDEEAAEAMDEQSGTLTSGKAKAGGHQRNQPPGEGIFGGGKGLWTEAGSAGTLYGDSGGASRFFYCAKAPKRERPSYLPVVLRLRDGLTKEQVDHVRKRLREVGTEVD